MFQLSARYFTKSINIKPVKIDAIPARSIAVIIIISSVPEGVLKINKFNVELKIKWLIQLVQRLLVL